MNDSLCGTNLTGEMIEHAFVNAGKASPGSLEKATATLLGQAGGHTSSILQVFLFWKENVESADRPRRIIVKILKQENIEKVASEFEPQLGEKAKEMFAFDHLFRVECAMYKMLPVEVPHFPVPKFYGSWTKDDNSLSFMAIEDLSHIAKMPDLNCGLTKDQLMSCAETLAALQAWSLTTQCEWKKELPGFENRSGFYLALMESTGSQLEMSISKYPTQLKCVDVEKLRATLSDKKKFMAAINEHRQLIPEVLVHGDFWGNNILFQVDNETNSISNRIVAIVDWQMSHHGSFAEDLSRLYTFSVDPELRRSTMKEVFHHYFDKMQILAPGKLNSVPFENAYRMFETTVFYGALMVVVVAHQFTMLIGRDNPALEAVMLRRLVENYKDAAKFFKF
uniref:CHK domain-containing protein n=1 Tax=Trichuris muris TaxID=70415 RepID=A0A5S6QKY4_TRIMR